VAAAVDAIGAKSEAAHALKDLKTFFNWCVPRYIKFSPCVGIKADHKYTPRSRLITPNELRAIWAAACQRRRKNASARRSKNTSTARTRRPPNWGPCV
jgi:hypothetical protein